ncbi:hypothetical protein [Pelagibacterium sp. H642]|uniref:hypothetical protein n=1 Tax=Pelagibacterium sp. H642 TaxID=1881069 RepID=UPI00281576A1|nr:hypothetical protein [Pelagibacterium sp. H642]WMT92566.1 hypothetical protein NO934_19660 [Pelagibacterium sp. H642]
MNFDLLSASKIIAYPKGIAERPPTFDKHVYPRLARALSTMSKKERALMKVIR